MKIMMTASLDPGKETAGKTHFLSLCRCFAKSGHDVTAILPSFGDPEEDARIPEELGINVVWTHSLTSSVHEWLLWGWIRTLVLGWQIVRLRPAMLYVRTRTSAPFFCMIARLVSPRLRVVSGHPGWVAYQLLACGQPRFQQSLARWSQLMNARFSSRIRVVADGIRHALIRGGIAAEKIYVVGNGTAVQRFRPVDAQEAWKATGLDASLTHLGFAGTLEKWQGVDRMLEAAKILFRDRENLRVLVVGSGPEEESLQKKAEELGIADRCMFVGAVPHAKMPFYINCFTIAVLFKCGLDEIAGSLYSSLKLRDYAACGVPILASRGAADHGIITQGKFGMLVDPENPSEVAQTVMRMLNDKTALEQMGQEGRRTAEAEFAWEKIAESVLCLALEG
ncbi:MAG: glycosyltransferase family 4 protein [Kiritimatiellia bacterium]|jgi:glycosyltransferase involved in cell wall biosynthesis|nr:glycosyltransferase family 4 protein [Kiritimatiellia bacterium]MDP6848882.1 glycosyltransferase family 4 protein [Kiritimatiellia bacterium]